jgi:asparagine synthase (glutamine-hydrolysing)
MCGIAGFLYKDKNCNYLNIITKMNDMLNHRGPDDSGIWFDDHSNIALSHKRLSILDLTEAGHQPMFSKTGRYIIVFNGEIYNHLEIRKKIQSIQFVQWNGSSDTETLLSSIEVFGLEKTLNMISGMFAFAIWDKKMNELIIARDRIGEKPLYYGWIDDNFYFASELKSIKSVVGEKLSYCLTALDSFLNHGYIKNPNTIWNGIYKLEPGSFITINNKCNSKKLQYYWRVEDIINKSKANVFTENFNNSLNTLESLLIKSISEQLLSDVPIGAFLSGGVDSSLIVSLMQKISNTPVNTFTIGFEDVRYNEAEYAKSIAKILKTNHTELYVSDSMARDVIPLINNIYDEPFGDSSAIPTYLVSKLAKTKVTVALSGDGGDELFSGYSRYEKANKINKIINYLSFLPIESLIKLFNIKTDSSRNIETLYNLIKTRDSTEFYFEYVNQWKTSPLLAKPNNKLYINQNRSSFKLDNFIENMMYLDMKNYLCDDILVKVDRAAMSCGLETRVPFLNKDVVEYAWQLPLDYKYQNGNKKFILKKILDKYIPTEIYSRPKMGFGAPTGEWIRGPLRDWAEYLLSEKNIKENGILDFNTVNKRWTEHKLKKHDWKDSLWNVLMLQSWINSQKN